MELFNVVTVEDTRKIIDENFKFEPLPEKVKLSDAVGRVIYTDVVSGVNVPGFRRSTVDGYAVRSRDVAGASESIPAMLDYKGEAMMGRATEVELSYPGECVYVPTGGMLPLGSDCVVMIEYTDKLDENTILINKPTAPGENVINEDDDIRAGEVLIKKGSKLRPYEIGVLSSIGHIEVEVVKRIRVGIISTGDEIVSPEKTPILGQVRDINTYLLSSLVTENGGESVIYGVCEDTYEDLRNRVDMAYKECDIVLISGGSSVGKKDQTLKVMESLGESSILVHGIAIKPGKPTVIGKSGKKIVFGLPGHPLACAVVFKAVVKYYIDRATGEHNIDYPIPCSFALNYHKAKGREEYLPVNIEFIDGNMVAVPIFAQSGIITAFSRAWGFVKIDRNIEGIREGDRVLIYKF
jgi:molybdopterin molybdotransferase